MLKLEWGLLQGNPSFSPRVNLEGVPLISWQWLLTIPSDSSSLSDGTLDRNEGQLVNNKLNYRAVECMYKWWPCSPMIPQYTRNWVYICSTSSAFYNHHSNTMSQALAKGNYRIRMWKVHGEHPQYLSVINGMVSVAGPNVPKKDQEVTRRFLTSLYFVSYQLLSGSSRS